MRHHFVISILSLSVIFFSDNHLANASDVKKNFFGVNDLVLKDNGDKGRVVEVKPDGSVVVEWNRDSEYSRKNASDRQEVPELLLPALYNQNALSESAGFKAGTEYYDISGDLGKVVAVSPDGDLLTEEMDYRGQPRLVVQKKYILDSLHRADFDGFNTKGFKIGDSVYGYSGQESVVVGIASDGDIAVKEVDGRVKTESVYDQESHLGRTSNPVAHPLGIKLDDIAYDILGKKNKVVAISDDGDVYLQPIDDEGNPTQEKVTNRSVYSAENFTFPGVQSTEEGSLRIGQQITSADGQKATVIAGNSKGDCTIKLDETGETLHLSKYRVEDFQNKTLAEFKEPEEYLTHINVQDFVKVGGKYFSPLYGELTATKVAENGEMSFIDEEGKEITIAKSSLYQLFAVSDQSSPVGLSVGEEVYKYGQPYKVKGFGYYGNVLLESPDGKTEVVKKDLTGYLAQKDFAGESGDGFAIGHSVQTQRGKKASTAQVSAIAPSDGELVVTDQDGNIQRQQYPSLVGNITNPRYPQNSPFKIGDEAYYGPLKKKGKITSVSPDGRYYLEFPAIGDSPSESIRVDSYEYLLSDTFAGSKEGELSSGDLFNDGSGVQATVIATNGNDALISYLDPKDPNKVNTAYFDKSDILKIKEESIAQFFADRDETWRLVAEGLDLEQATQAVETAKANRVHQE